jgi:hypothetical protein
MTITLAYYKCLRERLQPSRMEPLKDAPLRGKLLGLLTNFRLIWKGLPAQSLLLQTFVNYACKKFYNIGPWTMNCFS